MSGLQRALIIEGNPVDGFTFTGPFDSRDDAIDAGQNLPADWWVADLLPPEEP